MTVVSVFPPIQSSKFDNPRRKVAPNCHFEVSWRYQVMPHADIKPESYRTATVRERPMLPTPDGRSTDFIQATRPTSRPHQSFTESSQTCLL